MVEYKQSSYKESRGTWSQQWPEMIMKKLFTTVRLVKFPRISLHTLGHKSEKRDRDIAKWRTPEARKKFEKRRLDYRTDLYSLQKGQSTDREHKQTADEGKSELTIQPSDKAFSRSRQNVSKFEISIQMRTSTVLL
jgi:recombinational DNA repair protein RecT